MENFLFFYADLIILAASLIFTSIYTFKLSKPSKSEFTVRKLPLFFLLFAPMMILFNMCGHLGEILFRAFQRIMAGTFVYDYKFYSLILMGVLFLSISLYMLQQARAWCRGEKQAKINFIKAAVIVSVLSAPTAFFTPIGLLPTMVCVLSMIAVPFTIKRTSIELQLQSI